MKIVGSAKLNVRLLDLNRKTPEFKKIVNPGGWVERYQ
jgi:hypothetical protein